MVSGNINDNNPFADPSSHENLVEESTLTVGRNASLTLGTDSLIVLGWSLSSSFLLPVLLLTAE